MQLKRRPFRPPDTFHVHRSAPSLCQTNRPAPINLIGHRDCTETVSRGEETAGGENCSSEERGWSISVPRFTLFIVFFFSAFPFVLDQFFFSSIFIHSKIYFTLFSVISLETLEFLICRDMDQSFDEIQFSPPRFVPLNAVR